MTDDELKEAARLLDEWWDRGTFATEHARPLGGLIRTHLKQVVAPDFDSALEELPAALREAVTSLAESGPTPEIRETALAFLDEVAADQRSLMHTTETVRLALDARTPTNTGWAIPLLSDDSKPAFEAFVRILREGGMDDDYIARQAVDDHFRATGTSFHQQQHVVEHAVRQVPRE